MALKKYTLCFNGKNKYGHEHVFPIVSLDLKKMDNYTACYDNFVDLFNDLPSDVTLFIKENISDGIDLKSNKDLQKHIFIKDVNKIIFKDDIDILVREMEGLKSVLLKELISYNSYQKVYLKSRSQKDVLKRYNFFKYLYETYVKNEKIKCMIDTYDTKEMFSFLDGDELLIASIATDKDNAVVISKKLDQSFEACRDLLLKIKEFDSSYFDIKDISLKKDIEVNKVKEQMISFLDDYKKEYFEEYKI